MPINFRFVNDGAGIIAQGSGNIAAKDILDFHRDAYSSEDVLTKLLFVIFDFTGAESSCINAESIRLFAEKDKKLSFINSQIIFAVVVSDDLIYGLSRMWETYVEDSVYETNVFRDMKSAEKWLHERMKTRWNIKIDNLFQ